MPWGRVSPRRFRCPQAQARARTEKNPGPPDRHDGTSTLSLDLLAEPIPAPGGWGRVPKKRGLQRKPGRAPFSNLLKCVHRRPGKRNIFFLRLHCLLLTVDGGQKQGGEAAMVRTIPLSLGIFLGKKRLPTPSSAFLYGNIPFWDIPQPDLFCML